MANESAQFHAGDIVRHIPTGEKWVLACDQDGSHVSWVGWPEGTALASDCSLVKAATHDERIERLRATSQIDGNDHRGRLARHQLAQLVGVTLS